jgi:hypothetical protein
MNSYINEYMLYMNSYKPIDSPFVQVTIISEFIYK